MTEQYDNEYVDDNVYGHVVDLASRFGLRKGGAFLDFGCGYGRMAEVLRDRYDVRYIGLDINEPGLLSLKARGFDTMFLDLHDPDQALALIEKEIPAQASVSALCIIDTLEHLAEPLKALLMLRKLAQQHNVPLIVSVPNVTHRDIGFKLAMGMFDYTESGLLDYTHLQYFSEHRLEEMMMSAGWHEVHKKDVLMTKSDQYFPQTHAVLSEAAPLHQLLTNLRSGANGAGLINQFVRAYLPGPRAGARDSVPYLERREEKQPFLTVVTRTQGSRIDTLREVLLCLSAQTCQDFEVCVIGHDLDLERQLAVERVIADLHASMRERVRLVRVDGGTRATPLNTGFDYALGQYVAVLDDDDLVFGHWVETFHELAKKNCGQLLRLVAVAQHWDKVDMPDGGLASRAVGGMQAIYPEHFDLVAHLVENRSPLHSLAFPRSLFSDLKFRFDNALTTAEDWDFIIRVAPVAGVATSTNVGCIYRLWKTQETSFTTHSDLEWRANYFYTLRKLDKVPLLMPAGSVVRINNLYQELKRLRGGEGDANKPPSEGLAHDFGPDSEYVQLLQLRYHELVNSASWRLTGPLRWFKQTVRGHRREPSPKVWLLTVKDLEYLINGIEASSSWRMTRWLRNLRQIFH
ncbi:methyltransferase domain-containing protein [Rhodanobacter ginsengiterrae]|uniref:methyltransferase domain-containing protein n=1 Tax=Rhodanobacter ginsengiterrae TaxID=2008451 RepID=UPI003CFBBCFF